MSLIHPLAFEQFLEYVSRSEGGLSNNKNDYGGLTNRGVTIGTWSELAPKLFGIAGTAETLKQITHYQWRRIVKHYWDSVNADYIISPTVAFNVADWFWASGYGGVKKLQKLLNSRYGFSLTPDGKIGNKTLSAINSVNGSLLSSQIIAERVEQFKKQAQTSSQAGFLKGWLNRMNDLKGITLKIGVASVAFVVFFCSVAIA